MSEISNFDSGKKQILGHIEAFEAFCLGRRRLTPEQYQELNEELCLGAIMYVGRHHFEKNGDDMHFIWRAPDEEEHDLGPVDKLQMRDCPGFHRARSLALGHELVKNTEQMPLHNLGKHVSAVTMKDGTVGYGPNYKLALRNAVLKMHLKSAFKHASLWNIFTLFRGSA